MRKQVKKPYRLAGRATSTICLAVMLPSNVTFLNAIGGSVNTKVIRNVKITLKIVFQTTVLFQSQED